MTDDMTEFIRARLDGDQQAAEEANNATWVVGSTTDATGTHRGTHVAAMAPNPRMVADMTDGHAPSRNAQNCEHIARHDPARVLRAVAAKRAIVDECREMITAEASEADVLGWAILRQLASEWSTHPDYEAGWAP